MKTEYISDLKKQSNGRLKRIYQSSPQAFTNYCVKDVKIGLVGYLERNIYWVIRYSKNQDLSKKSIYILKIDMWSIAVYIYRNIDWQDERIQSSIVFR
jgi:hypothetical protein